MSIRSQVEVARAATELFRDDLASLTPAEWETPRACGEWSVVDVAGHVARGGELYASWIRRALEGITDPPAGAAFVVDRAAGSEGVLRLSRAYRQALGDRVLEGFERTGLALIELFESLRPADWRRPTFHPVGVIPIEKLLGWRIAELSLHRWDVLSRLGREASLPDGSHEPIVDWLPLWLRLCFEARQPLAEPRRYLFVLGSPLLRLLKLRILGDRFDLDPEGDEIQADAVLTTDPETFILLLMGRRAWQPALEDSSVLVGGSLEAADELPGWFRAF